MQNDQLKKDSDDLKKLGYIQELYREMGGFSNFAISFSIISILTGITQLYGYGLNFGGPAQLTIGWGVVSFFTILVSISMAELASSYPTAGALYHWSSILGGRAYGWFTACFNTVGQFAILAGIDYGLSLFLVNFLGINPDKTFLIYFIILFSHAFLNHIGIHWVSLLNNFSAWYHMVVVVLLIGAILFLVMIPGKSQPLSFLLKFHSDGLFSNPYSFLVGLLLAQWTLTGYDASAHVSEETIDPRRRAPWGIFLSVIVSVVFGALMLGVVTLSITDLEKVSTLGDKAFIFVLTNALGDNLGKIIIILLAGAMWLCGLAAMTSASRMVYAFARDGGLPFHKVWCYVSPKFKTPSRAIWGLFVFALLISISVDVYSSIVSIATISLYISYGMPIAARIYFRMRGKKDEIGPWNLGAWSNLVSIIGVLWICFVSIIFILPPNEQSGKVMGLILVGLLILWFGYVKKHFKGPKLN